MQSFQFISSSIFAHCLNKARADHWVNIFDVSLTICRCLQHRLSECSLILSVYNRNNNITTKKGQFQINKYWADTQQIKSIGIGAHGHCTGFPFFFTSHDSYVNQERFWSCWIIWVTWGSVFKQPKKSIQGSVDPFWVPFGNTILNLSGNF